MIMVGAMIESMSTENSHPKIAVLLFHFFSVMSVRKAKFLRPKGYSNSPFAIKLLYYIKYNEKANSPRGGDAKSWICQADVYRLADRQTAEVFYSAVRFKEVPLPNTIKLHTNIYINPFKTIKRRYSS